MKQATVKYHISEDTTIGTLIETIEDVNEFTKVVKAAEKGVLMKFVKSGEPDDRLNHVSLGMRPIERALGNLALAKAHIKGDSAIYHLGDCKDIYLTGLLSMVSRGCKVFINPNGGFCPVEGTMDIVSIEEVEYVANNAKPYISKYGTKVINLENDVDLENAAVDYMKNVLKEYNYSFIKELRLYSTDQLKRAFKAFVDAGGEIVYVYTTGRDVEQMYEYSTCAFESGLRKFIFQFNSGMDEDIKRFVDWLGQRADVKVV